MKSCDIRSLVAITLVSFVLLLTHIPDGIHSEGNLEVFCNLTDDCSDTNASCLNDTCVCQKNFFPDPESEACSAIDLIQLNTSLCTERQITVRWGTTELPKSNVTFNISCIGVDVTYSNQSILKDAHSTVFRNLAPGEVFKISIVAVYNDGNISYPVSKMTHKYVLTKPVLPKGMNTSVFNSTAFSFTWDASGINNSTYLRLNMTDISLMVPAWTGKQVIGGRAPGQNVTFSVEVMVSQKAPNGDVLNSTDSCDAASKSMSGLTYPSQPSIINITTTHDNATVTVKPGEGTTTSFEFKISCVNGTILKKDNTAERKKHFSGLEPHTTYTIEVTGFSNGLRSQSTSVNFTTKEFTPSIPLEVTVEPVSGAVGGIKVTWKPPTQPNGKLLYYELLWKNENEHSMTSFNVSATTPLNFSLSPTSAKPGTRHCFQIRVNNSYSFSNWTVERCYLLDDAKASEPSSLNVSSIEANSGVVTWHPPTTANGKILRYYVLLLERNVYTGSLLDNPCRRLIMLTNNCSSNCRNLTANGMSRLNNITSVCEGKNRTTEVRSFDATNEVMLRLDSLVTSTLYKVKVFAVNRAGPGSVREENFLTSQKQSEAPTSMTLSRPTATSLLISWSPISIQSSNGVVLQYLLVLQSNMSNGYNASRLCLTCHCTNCSARIDYRNLTNDGAALLASKKGSCIQWSGEQCIFSDNMASAIQVNYTRLHPFTRYQATVWPVNSLGPGRSQSADGSTSIDRPGKARRLHFTGRNNSTSLRFEWDPPLHPNGPFFKYRLWLQPTDHTAADVPSSQTYFVFSGLTACRKYMAYLVVINNASESSTITSNSSSFTLAVKPNPPSPPEMSVLSSTELGVSWSKVTVGDCPIKYKVEFAKSSATSWNRNTTAGLNIEFPDLKPHTAYKSRIQVTAGNDTFQSKTSEVSRESSLTTSESAPSAVLSLKCVQPPKFYDRLNCRWKEPQHMNGRLRNYNVAYSHANEVPIIGTTKNLSSTLEKLRPEISITVTVWAETVAPGPRKSWLGTLYPGPPRVSMSETVLKNLMTGKLKDVDNPSKQIKILVPCNPPIFTSSYGNILKTTVVIRANSSEEQVPDSEINATMSGRILTYSTSNAGKNGPYEPKEIKCIDKGSSRRRRAAANSHVSVIIGEQDCDVGVSDCSNGPLTPDTLYEIVIRGYTRGGAKAVGRIRVRTDPRSYVVEIVVPIVLLLLVGASAVVFVYFWRRRKTEKPNPPGSGQEGEDFELVTVPSAEDLARQAATGKSTPIPLDKFPAFVQQMNRNSHLLCTEAFNELKANAAATEQSMNLTTEEAAMQANRLKNRFANILPFDHTRVCLSGDDDPTSGSDYINANYISGYRRHREFIACQGPLPQTLDDFWRMIWEENVSVIVMLTLTSERGRCKCEQYWPQEDETRVYGDIAVRLYSESTLEVYALRLLDLISGGECRRVTHIQMLTWEDFSAPKADHLTCVMRAYRNHLAPGSGDGGPPTVVHCSAGVGRTGTFIGLDQMTRMIDDGRDNIDINDIILKMRRQRRFLVQSEKQYIFIHEFLLHYLRQRQSQRKSSFQSGSNGKPSPGRARPAASNGSISPDTAFCNNAYRDDAP